MRRPALVATEGAVTDHADGQQSGSRRRNALLGLVITVVLAGCVAASRGDQDRIGDWGLIQALPQVFFVCAAVLSLLFVHELFREHPNVPVLGACIIGLVLLLHGAPAFLEQEPRFPTAWLHAGFTDQFLNHHVSRPEVDARFNWPGFFGAAAAVTGAAGLDSALPLVRWAPVLVVLLYLPPLYVIGCWLTLSTRVAWLGMWLFVLVNWIGQDYFSPQGFAFVLYLLTIAILITFFRDGRSLPLPSRLSRYRALLPDDGMRDLDTWPWTRVGLLCLITLSAATLAVSHQLTPIMLACATTALLLVGRLRLLVLPVIVGVLTLGWISIGATPYWIGHLDVIFGGLGDVRNVVGTSVAGKVEGSPGHLAVISLRLYFTAAMWLCAFVAALMLGRRGRLPVTLVALALAPFAALLQKYGDEGVLRIYLFSSPFASLVMAKAMLTGLNSRNTRFAAQAMMSILVVALIPIFLVTRYGNESFEQVRANEVKAMRALYRIAPLGSNLVSPTSQIPWRFEHAADYDYSRPTNADKFLRGEPSAVRGVLSTDQLKAPGTYLIVTTSQKIYAYQSLGYGEHWFKAVRPLLTPENGYRVVYSNPDAVIYEFEAPR